MHLAGEIDHPLETGQGLFPLVVVVAEADAQLVGDGPLLHAADEQVDLLLLDEIGTAPAGWCRRPASCLRRTVRGSSS